MTKNQVESHFYTVIDHEISEKIPLHRRVYLYLLYGTKRCIYVCNTY